MKIETKVHQTGKAFAQEKVTHVSSEYEAGYQRLLRVKRARGSE